MDSGATTSCVNDGFCNSLEKKGIIKEFKKCYTKMFTAEGASQIIRQKALVPFKIGKKVLSLWCMIYKGLHRPLILGVNFLKKYNVDLSYRSRPDGEYMIQSRHKMVIPPNSELDCSCEVVSEKPLKGKLGITENLYRKEHLPFLVKRVLTQSKL